MASLQCIAYVSAATHLMSEADLEALFVDIQSLNLASQTTGVLLYSEGTFFQYLETTEETMRWTFERIRQSRKHTGIVELLNEPILERSFTDWQMGFPRASKSHLLVRSTEQWQARVATSVPSSACAGLALALDFWSRSGG